MPASTISIGGRRTAIPGAYALINPAGLQGGTAGIKSVVLIGEAEGGIPVTVQTDGLPTLYAATNQNQVRGFFRSGLLRDSALASFNPGAGVIPQRVVMAKVNPATQSSATLANPNGNVLTVTSRDYGAFTATETINIAPGTSQGYLASVTLNSTVEAQDNLGGSNAFTARYSTSGDFDTVRGEVDATGLTYTYTKSIAEDEVTATHDAGDRAVVRSANAYDTVQHVTVFGILAGVAVSGTVTLNGTSSVLTTQTFTSITAVRVNGATRGIITIEDENGIPNVAFTIPATITADQTLGAIEVVSSSALDLGQRIVVTGVSSAGTAVSQTLTLNGTTVAPGAVSFAKVLTARLSGACAGNVTVRGISGGPVAFVIAAGNLTAGINIAAGAYIPNIAAFEGPITLDLIGSGPSNVDVVVRGISTAGVQVAEVFNATATAAPTLTGWSTVTQIEIGLMDAAQTLLIAGNVRSFAPTVTVGDMADAMNGTPGFVVVPLVSGAPTFAIGRLDYADASLKGATDVGYIADLDAIITWINTTTLMSAVRLAGATGAPSLTPAPVALIGGSEGTTTVTDWLAAFNALVGLRDIYIVPLTTNPAIHAQLKAHLAFMEGAGNHEQSGFVPLATSLSKTNLISAIKLINSRNIAAVAQGVRRFSPDNGDPTDYGPEVFAAMCAALNAALGVGVPLTRKAVEVIAFIGSTTWSPVNDADEMILAGLMFGSTVVDGIPRIVRSVTTWRNDSNPVFTEVSPNDSANESVRRVRRACDTLIGSPAFSGFSASLKGVVQSELDAQVADGVIRAYQSIVISDLGDTFDVGYELQAIEGVNFIKITANLRRFAAA